MAEEKDNKEVLKELKRIHEEYMGKMRKLEKQQRALMKSVIERIDKEKASDIMKNITEGDQEI